MFYRRFFKPVFDRLFAALLLALLSPAIALTALLIRLKLGSPIVFSQARPGKGARIFTIHKFRTMREALGKDGKPLPDEERLGSFGGAVRSLSLDELLQLVNVLKGEMSFIGPRPLLTEYLPRYNARQARRHEVLPGITGWAQVNGRNAQSWEDRFEYDLFYVDNPSFFLDLKIALLTIAKIIGRDGVSESGAATKGAFLGNGDRVYVFGGGGHGRVAAECAKRLGLRVEGFIDDNPNRGVSPAEFFEIAGKERFGAVLGIGDNRARKAAADRLEAKNIEIKTLIDPSAAVSETASIGRGAIALAGAIVNSGAVIGAGAIVNSGAIVEHDCEVGDYAHISPNAALAGGAKALSFSHIGIGAVLTQNAVVKEGAIIGAGAAVLGEIGAGETAAGVPARVIKGSI